MRPIILSLVLNLLASLTSAIAADADYNGPIFDTHMHYSRSAWQVYSPADVVAMMDKANIARALVSSTPDDGTVTLKKIALSRVIKGLRPYRTSSEKTGWYKNPDLLTYAQKRLAPGSHKALGEVILNYPDELETPQMTEYLKIAAKQQLVLHFHTGADVIEALMQKNPAQKVLWAHAGFSEPPAVIGRLLDQYANLSAELSYRAEEIMGGNDVEPEWKALLIRHKTRFTIGSDTWQNGRWQNYQYLISQHREWLGKLPIEVAEMIAFANAQKMLGQ